jgi:D-serine deaminase-like pyridoxal phosphate-dependent protein
VTTPADPEALVGGPLDALTTPCVVVDAPALEHNLRLLADYFATRHCKLRPHFKAHKCVELARRQLAAGSATGITCAKLTEAEVLVEGDITDILIANQVVGAGKARRLAELARRATVRVAVDSAGNVEELDRAARSAGAVIGVLVEVDIGMNRCGVPPGKPTLTLAARVAEARNLRFDGLQGYEGHVVQREDADARRRGALASMALLMETKALLVGHGLAVRIVSSGGTGTYDMTGNVDGVDEVQCGTYALMDACYTRIRPEFRVASFLLSTVVSSRGTKVVADVGTKGMGCEFGPPLVEGFPDAKVLYVADEHTPIENVRAEVGDRLRLIPSHGCTTHNLHRRMWVVRDGTVEGVWAVEGSGCLE